MRRRRREDAFPFGRAMLRGGLCLALPILLQVLLIPVLGDGFLVFLLFFVALIPPFGAALIYCGSSLVRLFLAALLMVGVPFASLALPDARIFGWIATRTVQDAPESRAAAGIRLPDAAPAPGFARVVAPSITVRGTDARGRPAAPSTRRGRFAVVPIVAAGWTPDQPVAVVGVQDLDDAGEPAVWAQAGGVLRLLPDRLREQAVRHALKEAGLTAAPGIVIGRWVESPGWARLDAAVPLLLLYADAMAAWALLLVTAPRGRH